jgi:NADH-quinone oxidoreductase subunit L
MEGLIQTIVLAPFVSVALLFLLRRQLPKSAAAVIGCGAVLVPFLCTVAAFFQFDGTPVTATLTQWMTGSVLNVPFAFRLDQLSLTWTLVVTGIGFLIHVYSVGYMHEDPSFVRFFTYLNLFVGSMLCLVLGDSMVLLFLGWEGVGLCSYLLIGFWFDEEENAKAGQKAFVVNRIGDLGFLVAMVLVFKQFGTLNIAQVNAMASAQAATLDPTLVTSIALALFVGCCGKSAQLPLYTWLPDAMAGPTPVSALIHAATMVTAGIYLVARMSIFFAMSPTASTVVAVVGCATALFAATIGLRQRDIKKVLAYSTVSQLGYMFLALGIGAYTAGVFHVITHAFFKALLFLGAGSVIHALHHEQDAMRMGGLKKYLPITHKTFLIGSLALAGIAPFAGFFSKDKILGAALYSHGLPQLLGVFGLITALMTAFYTFRLYALVFHGEERFGHGTHAHADHGGHAGHGGGHGHDHAKPHESPFTMTFPLMVLAVLAVLGGALSLPHFAHSDLLGKFLEPIFAPAYAVLGAPHEHSVAQEVGAMLVSLVLALGGAWFGFSKFSEGPGKQAEHATKGLPFLLENKWFVDEIYNVLVVGPMRALSHLAGFFDRLVVDGLVNGVAGMVRSAGGWIRMMQNGALHTYALLFILGAAYLAIVLL